jgi:hypothetical protein
LRRKPSSLSFTRPGLDACDAKPLNPRPETPETPAVKRAGWITKLNLFSDGKCLVGIKPTYGYKSSDAQILGRESVDRSNGGQIKDLLLYPHSGEFVIKAEARVGDK